MYESPARPSLPQPGRNGSIMNWRADFFEEIHMRFTSNAPPEDIDLTHRRVLDRLPGERGFKSDDLDWDNNVLQKLFRA